MKASTNMIWVMRHAQTHGDGNMQRYISVNASCSSRWCVLRGSKQVEMTRSKKIEDDDAMDTMASNCVDMLHINVINTRNIKKYFKQHEQKDITNPRNILYFFRRRNRIVGLCVRHGGRGTSETTMSNGVNTCFMCCYIDM